MVTAMTRTNCQLGQMWLVSPLSRVEGTQDPTELDPQLSIFAGNYSNCMCNFGCSCTHIFACGSAFSVLENMAQEGRLRAFRKTPWITNSEIDTQLLLKTPTLQHRVFSSENCLR
ncbi:hypothetical protein DR999_PMT03849 [Platysternon megacephalum]|uniref:Uncharacterized protein n=1 Tax=Platysternon megacephalum TaxID=55544 RepID=A0A4D9EV15_9SAUR|nr:hypothetical protein DR999_PMT03849 [Platysternon megacephalum]